MRTGSSIPQLAKLMRRSGTPHQRTDSQGAHPDPLHTIGEDDLESMADEVVCHIAQNMLTSSLSVTDRLHDQCQWLNLKVIQFHPNNLAFGGW